jgi:hypothetical protein
METNEQLEPGPELDRLVAEKMGYKWEIRTGGLGHEVGRWVKAENGDDAFPASWSNETGLDQPEYSSDIASAWQVVEYLISKAYWTKLLMHYSPAQNYQFMIGDKGGEFEGWGWSPCDYSEEADTAPLAICLAFLAIEEGKGE